MKIHIKDSVYEKLKELAGEQNRSISNMAETILTNVWGKQPADPMERKNNPSAEIKESKVLEDLKKAGLVEKASEAVCKGHDSFRRSCGKKGCQYA